MRNECKKQATRHTDEYPEQPPAEVLRGAHFGSMMLKLRCFRHHIQEIYLALRLNMKQGTQTLIARIQWLRKIHSKSKVEIYTTGGLLQTQN